MPRNKDDSPRRTGWGMANQSVNMRASTAIERYLTRLENSGQAGRSLYTAKYTLARWYNSLPGNPFVHTVTQSDMDDYFYGANGIRKNIKSVSFNRYRSVLKRFFDYCLDMRWVDRSPMDGIQTARPDQEGPKLMLSAGELLSLLDHTNNPVERIACAVGMNTGLRANDIKNLTIFDVSLQTGVIQTEIRKSRKFDDKPITADLHNELVRWLKTYAELTGLPGPGALPNEWLLIPSYRLPPKREDAEQKVVLRPTTVLTHPWRLVQRPLGRMGYPTTGTGFHTLRRSSARAFFESLRDRGEARDHALMIVKDYLNHSNTTMTEKYLGLNAERTIRNAILRDQPFLSRMAEGEQARVTEERVENLRGVPRSSAL